jgi:ABC-type phosphate transport system permease subunit
MDTNRLDLVAERVLQRWTRLTLLSGMFHCMIALSLLSPRLLYAIESVLMAMISIDTAVYLQERGGEEPIGTRVHRLLLIILSGAMTILYALIAVRS